MGKGGPPRHVHFEQDEWFYVIKGDYVFEVGGGGVHPAMLGQSALSLANRM